jgi:hypothetical protein
MNKNTTALIIVHNGQLLLAPSKSDSKKDWQVDPPCWSKSFNFEKERVDFIKNEILPAELSGKNFNKHFKLFEEPIKFPYRDELGEKLFTGYVALIRNEKTIKENFIIDESELWEPIVNITGEETKLVITPMFKRAINEVYNRLPVLLAQ